MSSVTYDIAIEQGATFQLVFFMLPPPTTFVIAPYAELLGQDAIGSRPASGNVKGDLWYDADGLFSSRWSRWTGTAWSNVTPTDITGWSARMAFRRTYASATPVFTLTSPVVAGTGVDLGGVHGSITIRMTAAQTTGLDPTWSGGLSGVYDLELYDTSSPVVVNRISRGKWVLSVESTR